MKQIKVNKNEINILEGWSEMTLGNYIDLTTLYEKYNNKEIIEEELMMMFLTLVSDLKVSDIMRMDIDDIIKISTENIPNFKTEDFKKKECRHFILNGNNYGIIIPTKINYGELISIKLLEKQSKTIYDQWLSRLCILVRPATPKINEFGETYWECEEFNSDMEILFKRKELLKQIPAVNALWLIEAFPNGI